MNICSNNLDYPSQHKAHANNFKFCKFDSKRHPGTVITRVKLIKMLVNRMIDAKHHRRFSIPTVSSGESK